MKRSRTKRTLARATGVAALLASLVLSVPGASAQRRILASFDATIEETPARTVLFEWSISAERAGEDITCTIDVDVDDPGTVDESVSDCDEDTSFEHTYEEPGIYRAAITATSAAGGSDRALVTVVVR
jgi:hypothetical protein